MAPKLQVTNDRAMPPLVHVDPYGVESPVFDVYHGNCYFIADSNHEYKILGVGKLVAEGICNETSSTLLQPFRFSRYELG